MNFVKRPETGSKLPIKDLIRTAKNGKAVSLRAVAKDMHNIRGNVLQHAARRGFKAHVSFDGKSTITIWWEKKPA